MAALTKARFRDWEVGEIWAKAVDRGFDGLKLVRGWGSGIVYRGERFRVSHHIGGALALRWWVRVI
jgi:hypothetical protein